MAVDAKICGLKDKDAVDAAVRGGARSLGFNFYPPSPRFVLPAQARELSAGLPASVDTVALIVNADDSHIQLIADTLNPSIFQLHGAESADRVQQVKALTGKPVIKAVPIAGPTDIDLAHGYESAADLLLFDAKPPKSLPDALPGGNALAFDWSLISEESWSLPWLLAGGLTAENVTEAVRVTKATYVDVSSGVEAKRGQKDPALILEFLDIVSRL